MTAYIAIFVTAWVYSYKRYLYALLHCDTSSSLVSGKSVMRVIVQGYGSKNRETRETREKNAQNPKLGRTRQTSQSQTTRTPLPILISLSQEPDQLRDKSFSRIGRGMPTGQGEG